VSGDFYRLELGSGVVLYKPIDLPANGTAVLGVAGKRIVLISAFLTVSANTTLQWFTSSGPVELTGPHTITATGGYVMPFNAGGWFQTLVGDSLLLNTGAALGGCLSYALDGK